MGQETLPDVGVFNTMQTLSETLPASPITNDFTDAQDFIPLSSSLRAMEIGITQPACLDMPLNNINITLNFLLKVRWDTNYSALHVFGVTAL